MIKQRAEPRVSDFYSLVLSSPRVLIKTRENATSQDMDKIPNELL